MDGVRRIIDRIGELISGGEDGSGENAGLLDRLFATLDSFFDSRKDIEELGDNVRSEGFESFEAYKAEAGRAPPGYQQHDIVPQASLRNPDIAADQIHNRDNIVRVPTLKHHLITGEYNKPAPDGRAIRDWLADQPLEIQREFGLKLLRKHAVISN